MLYSLTAQAFWPDQKCLFTLRSGDLGGTMLLWRPWWHRAAVGPRVLAVHAGGALGFNRVRTHGVNILLSATELAALLLVGLSPWRPGLGEGIAERLGLVDIAGERDLAPGGEILVRSPEVRRPDSSRRTEVRGPDCASAC